MRARILTASASLLILAACSERADEPVAEAPREEPELAMQAASDEVPVASNIEVHQPAPDAVPTPAPAPEPQPTDEPLGSVATEPVVAEAEHEHHDAATAPAPVAVERPARGGGKPAVGMAEGEGLIPDREWTDVGIMDNPNPIPNVVTGRPGAVIIRGGAGRIDDDCAIHPRGLAGILGGMGGGERPGGAIINDRDPRRGALINERAPRARTGGSMPRGAGFPGGGIRFR